MSKTGVSITVYSVYMTVAGTALALVPNLPLGLFGYPTHDYWVRVTGLLMVLLAVKGWVAGVLWNSVPNIRLDIVTRLGFSAALTALILAGAVPPILFLFAALDLLGAAWTQATLSAARRAAAAS